MAQLPGMFDSNNHQDMRSAFDPIPKNTYTGQITASDIIATKAGDGKYIKFEFTVVGGEFNGRKIWQQLNIINPNQQAVQIAQEELATICRACGKLAVADTVELHGIPMALDVAIVPAKGDYPAKNKISGYKPAGAGVSVNTAQPAPQNPDADPPGNTEPATSGGVPWA